MNEQDIRLMQEYNDALALAQAQQMNQMPYSSSMMATQTKQNLVEWELDFKPELEDIERLLRCDVLTKDSENNEVWIPNPDKSKIFLNDLGVNDVLRKIRLLVNKNKVLSNYTIEEIRLRVKLIMNELRVLIYNNYEQYGIDNEYKMNNYSMIVLTIGSLIEDAYRRALGGETHKGLNEQRLVSQNENVNSQPQYPVNMNFNMNKNKSWLKPWTWGK